MASFEALRRVATGKQRHDWASSLLTHSGIAATTTPQPIHRPIREADDYPIPIVLSDHSRGIGAERVTIWGDIVRSIADLYQAASGETFAQGG